MIAASGLSARLSDHLAGLCMIVSSDNALVTVKHVWRKAGKGRRPHPWWRKRDWR
jgi:hypothetical protein